MQVGDFRTVTPVLPTCELDEDLSAASDQAFLRYHRPVPPAQSRLA